MIGHCCTALHGESCRGTVAPAREERSSSRIRNSLPYQRGGRSNVVLNIFPCEKFGFPRLLHCWYSPEPTQNLLCQGSRSHNDGAGSLTFISAFVQAHRVLVVSVVVSVCRCLEYVLVNSSVPASSDKSMFRSPINPEISISNPDPMSKVRSPPPKIEVADGCNPAASGKCC